MHCSIVQCVVHVALNDTGVDGATRHVYALVNSLAVALANGRPGASDYFVVLVVAPESNSSGLLLPGLYFSLFQLATDLELTHGLCTGAQVLALGHL